MKQWPLELLSNGKKPMVTTFGDPWSSVKVSLNPLETVCTCTSRRPFRVGCGCGLATGCFLRYVGECTNCGFG